MLRIQEDELTVGAASTKALTANGLPIAVRHLAISGLIGGLLIFMDGVRLIVPLFAENSGTNAGTMNLDALIAFLISFLAAIIIGGCLCTILGALCATTTSYGFIYPLRFGGVIAALGFTSAWVLQTTYGLTGVLQVLCGLICGGGIIAVSISWCTALAALDELRVLSVLALGCLVAALTKALALVLPGIWLVVLVVALFSASTIVPKQQSRDAKTVPTSTDEHEETVTEQVRSMLGRNWTLYCGWLLCVTIAAGIWSFTIIVGNSMAERPIPNTSDSIPGCIVGALLLLLCSWFLRAATIRTLYLILPLVSVASLIVIWFVGGGALSDGIASFAPLGFSAVVCGSLHISRLSSETNRGLSPLLVFGLPIFVAASLSLAWFGVWPLLGSWGATAVDLAFKVIYLVAVAAQMIVLTQRQSVVVTQTGNHILTQICSRMTDQFALSKRESEILLYVLQGRSSTYIAEQQFVSINTVKTHIKRIYEKTGVHSKQELLDIALKD
jgi:DNA-binding CsgD family transcriptional regulator